MTNLHKTGAAALITAAFLTLALLFTGCPQAAKPKPKHAITFSVDGTGGTLKATAGGSAINSGNEVEEGKTVTFTAKADAGYRLKGWTLDGNAVNGTAETYTLTVTQPVTIKVNFELMKALLTLAAGKNTVKVKAKTADGSAIKVEGCSVNELANEAETTLTVTDSERKLALIGDIIELNCRGEIAVGGNRPLIALDASGLTALQKLECDWNQLTALNVQGLKALQELNCNTNQIPELNVQGLTKLQKLYCKGNKLTTLNVSDCTALKELICYSNGELSTLDVQGLTALQKLECYNNQLATLNVRGLTALQELDCNTNKIPELNVQGLTKLQQLKCGGNQLTALDVQGCTALQNLDCGGNQLSTLNVQGIATLKELYCENNQLATLNVQGCASLQKLDCSGSEAHRYLSELNVQGCTALKILLCYKNKLNADAFTKLFNDLPAREVSDKAKALLYSDKTASEDNCTDFSTPESLKKAFENAKNIKHWKLQKMDGYIEEDI